MALCAWVAAVQPWAASPSRLAASAGAFVPFLLGLVGRWRLWGTWLLSGAFPVSLGLAATFASAHSGSTTFLGASALVVYVFGLTATLGNLEPSIRPSTQTAFESSFATVPRRLQAMLIGLGGLGATAIAGLGPLWPRHESSTAHGINSYAEGEVLAAVVAGAIASFGVGFLLIKAVRAPRIHGRISAVYGKELGLWLALGALAWLAFWVLP